MIPFAEFCKAKENTADSKLKRPGSFVKLPGNSKKS